MRTPDGRVYGPVERAELDRWVAEGRVAAGCQVRPSGEARWQDAASQYPQLATEESTLNPYAASHSPHGRHFTPHRGPLILILGILGLLVCNLLAPAAWVMGTGDLREMRAGRMDPSGAGLTQAGQIVGIVGTVLMILSLLIFLMFLLVAVVA